MARIALAWELGAGFGHLGRLLPVAGALRRVAVAERCHRRLTRARLEA